MDSSIFSWISFKNLRRNGKFDEDHDPLEDWLETMLSKVGERLTVGAGEVETGTTTFGAEFAMETGTTTFGAEFEIGGEFTTTFCATGIA